jgi:hypothetical protein
LVEHEHAAAGFGRVARPDAGRFLLPLIGDAPIVNRRRHARRLVGGLRPPSHVMPAHLSGIE